MRIHVIVNPSAGRRTIQKNLEQIVGRLVLDGTATNMQVTRTQGSGDARAAAATCTAEDTDLIIGCGGDGTINEIVNGMMEGDPTVPLAILAAGTSNDFASALHLPDDPDEFCAALKAGNYRYIDLGLANDKDYFINVACFGIFTNVAHTTDRDAKNNMGKMAYYLKAASTVPAQLEQCTQLDIISDGKQFSGYYALCVVSNSMSVGSFRKLMRKADVSDGVFDVLMLKRPTLIPNNNSLEVPCSQPPDKTAVMQYFQTTNISFQSPQSKKIDVDIDGEYYGALPLNIRVCPNSIRLLVPEQAATNLNLL